MSVGWTGNAYLLSKEMTSFPITEIVNVELGDIDNLAYWAETVGYKKEIKYYDEGMNFIVKEVFEYNPTTKVDLLIIKKVTDAYLGLYDASGNVTPTITVEKNYYFIEKAGTLDGVSFVKGDVIMLLNGKVGKVVFDGAYKKWKSV